MYDLPLILGVVGFLTLIIILFNIFFVYQPILELGGEIESLKIQIDTLIKKYEPQIKLVESLFTSLS